MHIKKIIRGISSDNTSHGMSNACHVLRLLDCCMPCMVARLLKREFPWHYFFEFFVLFSRAMLFFRMFRRSQSNRGASVFHLLFCAILFCLSIYAWKSFGCPGFPECYLCRTFTPDCFLNPAGVNISGDDFTRLMNLKNFKFLMNNSVCNNTDLLLLVLVHSDPYNYEKRLTIRNTWGKAIGNKFKLMFLLGIPNSTFAQKHLDEENYSNGDLVQGNFIDTYRNLTYKHVMALKWMKYFCPNAKYLLKTDDDVFVNSPGLLHYISRNFPKKKLMRCLPIYEGVAQRTSRSKWRVTWSEYKFRRYPPFCQGFAILYSPDVALTLYAKAQIASYFWIDDVFITGFLAKASNFTPSTFGKFLLEPQEFHWLMSKNSRAFSYLLGPWNLSVEEIRKLWERALKIGYDTAVVDS